MKNRGMFKLRLIFGAFILVMTVFTGPYSSAIASSDGIPGAAPEHQTDPGAPPTNQIIIKYRDTANATDHNGQIKAEKISALSTAAVKH